LPAYVLVAGLEEAGRVKGVLDLVKAGGIFMELSGDEGRFGREEVRSISCIRGDN